MEAVETRFLDQPLADHPFDRGSGGRVRPVHVLAKTLVHLAGTQTIGIPQDLHHLEFGRVQFREFVEVDHARRPIVEICYICSNIATL